MRVTAISLLPVRRRKAHDCGAQRRLYAAIRYLSDGRNGGVNPPLRCEQRVVARTSRTGPRYQFITMVRWHGAGAARLDGVR
jgi:hypothetical protein